MKAGFCPVLTPIICEWLSKVKREDRMALPLPLTYSARCCPAWVSVSWCNRNGSLLSLPSASHCQVTFEKIWWRFICLGGSTC